MTTDRPRVREYAVDDRPPPGYERRAISRERAIDGGPSPRYATRIGGREQAANDVPPPGYETRRIDGNALRRGGQPKLEGERARTLRGMTVEMLRRSVGFQTR